MSFGRRIVDDKMPLDNPQIISRYLSLTGEHRIPIDGTCVDRLHDNGLKRDQLAIKWVLDAIRLMSALRASVLLLPFFGKCAIENPDERNAVGNALREVAPEAGKAGVVLGIEDTLSAEDNMRELGIDISGHRSKKVDEFKGQQFDYVITVCDNANESCPVFFGKAERLHHDFVDPATLTGSEEERLELFRRVRDELQGLLCEFSKRVA